MNYAYLAGYTDAEGCLAVYHSQTAWHIQIGFHQVDTKFLMQIKNEYGGSLVVDRPRKGRLSYKLSIYAFADAMRFLRDVYPNLREKNNQALAIMQRFDSKNHTACYRLYEDLKEMKQKQMEPFAIENRLSVLSADPNRKCFMCDAKAHGKGYCGKHYQQAVRDGTLVIEKRAKSGGVMFRYGRQPSEEDKAYYAGYFDGDGCVMVFPMRGTWRSKIAFIQTTSPTLRALHATYGGSLKFTQSSKKNTKVGLAYQLAQTEAVKAMLCDLQPYAIEKRPQIDLVLQHFRHDMTQAEGNALKSALTALKKQIPIHPESLAISH